MRKDRLYDKCLRCIKYELDYTKGPRCMETNEIIPTYRLFNSPGICTLYDNGFKCEYHMMMQEESFIDKIKRVWKRIFG